MLKANIHFCIIQVHYLQTLTQGSLNFPAINLHEGEFKSLLYLEDAVLERVRAG